MSSTISMVLLLSWAWGVTIVIAYRLGRARGTKLEKEFRAIAMMNRAIDIVKEGSSHGD